MLQPARNLIRAAARRYSLQCCNQSAKVLVASKFNFKKCMNQSRRQFHHATEKNVITSNLPDVPIPNCLLSDYIWHEMDKWADKTAVVCGITGRGYTYGQAHKMCIAFAACLRNKMKIRDGDVLAVMLPNSPEFPLAAIGAIHAGCVVTTVNPIYITEEIQRQFENSNTKVVVTTLQCYPDVKKAIDNMKREIPIILTEVNGAPLPEGAINFSEFAENFGENTDCLKTVKRTPEDTVFLPYSSGTTGLPKGVELSHRNIVANCQQQVSGKVSIMRPTTATHQDVTVCVLPFYHIYGLTVTLLSRMATGIKIVTVPKFQPDTFLNAQLKYKGSVIFVVPPIVLFLTNHHLVKQEHLDPLRTLNSGAAPLAASDVNRFLDKARNKNIAFMQGYGLTETSPVVLMQERGNINYASVGTPTPNTDCKIVDLKNEQNVLGPNQVGELWIRGPQVMKGYLNNPAANEDIFRPGGWLRTGDMSYYDDNDSFYITDRLKELIKVKGFQVAPAELEGILRSHPELDDAAVIGVPHEHHGETPKAFVVKKEGFSPTPESVMDFVAQRVSSFKKLGGLVFVDAIPKNAAGKILRREMREKFT